MSQLQVERRDRGPQGWPQDCYCDKYGPDGIPHLVKNKEERYNHKRRYARRNVVQANLHLHTTPPDDIPSDPIANDMDEPPMNLDVNSEENAASSELGSPNRDGRRHVGTHRNDRDNSFPNQGSQELLSDEMDIDTLPPTVNDAHDLSNDLMESSPSTLRLEATIEPEDLEARSSERYADIRVSIDMDVDGNADQFTDFDDEMRSEFPEFFDWEGAGPGSADAASFGGENTPAGSSDAYESPQVGDTGSSVAGEPNLGIGARALNEGIDMDTPNITMLRELNSKYPYGHTTFMDVPEDLAIAFDYFRVKVQHNMPNSAFEDMMKVFNRMPVDQEESYQTVASTLGNYTAINHVRYDCCRNNCVCFVDWPGEQLCPMCGESRSVSGPSSIPHTTFDYIPITHRLRLLLANPVMAKKMNSYVSHRHKVNENNPTGVVTDFWDGQLFKDLHNKGFFEDTRDIALAFSTDGLQLFKIGTYDVWPLLVLILNLPPTERVEKDNMILLGLIPGPKKPTDLDSFLRPFIDEMKLLLEGVETIDGSSGETFRMRAHLTIVTADMPAMATLTATRGANAYAYCRFCRIRGTYCKSKRHIYCPLIPPIDDPTAIRSQARRGQSRRRNSVQSSSSLDSDVDNILSQEYDPRRLPLWTDEEFRLEAATVVDEDNIKIGKLSGINYLSIFAELPTIEFPRSFPIDIMHLVYEGLAQQMVSHWRGEYFAGADIDPGLDYVMPVKVWKQIGEELAASRTEFPTSFGRAPRDITKYKYKASEWMNWVSILSPIYLKDRLPEKYYDGWMGYVEAVNLMRKWVLTQEEINRMDTLITSFVEHYEAEYYRYETARLSACRATIHYQLHIAQCVRDLGPPGIYWQYPMERQCGYLTRMVKSRAAANRNLSLGILHMTRLSFLKIAYPSIKFTETSTDRSDKQELHVASAIHVALGNDDPSPQFLTHRSNDAHNLTPRIYTTSQYARQGIAVTHYHWRGPSKKSKLDKSELHALNSFIRRRYPSQYQRVGRLHDEVEDGVIVTQYSNCWINHQLLGSNLTPLRETGVSTTRLSSLIMYTYPRNTYGSRAQETAQVESHIDGSADDRTFIGYSRFYTHVTIPGVEEELLLVFVERQDLGRHAGSSTVFLAGENRRAPNQVNLTSSSHESDRRIAVDCVDVRAIHDLMGVVQSRGKRWLCNRITSVI